MCLPFRAIDRYLSKNTWQRLSIEPTTLARVIGLFCGWMFGTGRCRAHMYVWWMAHSGSSARVITTKASWKKGIQTHLAMTSCYIDINALSDPSSEQSLRLYHRYYDGILGGWRQSIQTHFIAFIGYINKVLAYAGRDSATRRMRRPYCRIHRKRLRKLVGQVVYHIP